MCVAVGLVAAHHCIYDYVRCHLQADCLESVPTATHMHIINPAPGTMLDNEYRYLYLLLVNTCVTDLLINRPNHM